MHNSFMICLFPFPVSVFCVGQNVSENSFLAAVPSTLRDAKDAPLGEYTTPEPKLEPLTPQPHMIQYTVCIRNQTERNPYVY